MQKTLVDANTIGFRKASCLAGGIVGNNKYMNVNHDTAAGKLGPIIS